MMRVFLRWLFYSIATLSLAAAVFPALLLIWTIVRSSFSVSWGATVFGFPFLSSLCGSIVLLGVSFYTAWCLACLTRSAMLKSSDKCYALMNRLILFWDAVPPLVIGGFAYMIMVFFKVGFSFISGFVALTLVLWPKIVMVYQNVSDKESPVDDLLLLGVKVLGDASPLLFTIFGVVMWHHSALMPVNALPHFIYMWLYASESTIYATVLLSIVILIMGVCAVAWFRVWRRLFHEYK